MTPDRWARIDQLLDEVMDRPAAERSTFLDEACGEDIDLRREIQSLLDAHQKAEAKFLKLPALDLAAQHLAGEKDRSLIGQMLGAYSIISVLGIGGMGEVYLARDTRLARKVALKLLPPQYTQDAARIKRFEREARAASALNHPNIITIYEIGQIEDKFATRTGSPADCSRSLSLCARKFQTVSRSRYSRRTGSLSICFRNSDIAPIT